MNIDQIRSERSLLGQSLLKLLQEFEETTDSKINSIEFHRWNGSLRMGLGGDGKISHPIIEVRL